MPPSDFSGRGGRCGAQGRPGSMKGEPSRSRAASASAVTEAAVRASSSCSGSAETLPCRTRRGALFTTSP